MLLSTLSCSTAGQSADPTAKPSDASPKPQVSAPSNTPLEIDVDESEWAMVVRILAAEDYGTIGDISSTAELMSIPTISKEYYRLKEGAGEIETVDRDGQIVTFNSGCAVINGEDEKILCRNLIMLCTDNDALIGTLESLGVTDEPKNSAFVTALGYPLLLFVECEDGVRFITIDDEDDGLKRDTEHLDEYVFRVYSPAEFKDKFGPKIISVYVNGQLATDCRAVMRGKTEEIYLMTVLRCLDPAARIDIDGDRAQLSFLGRDYTIDLRNQCITPAGDTPNDLLPAPGSVSICYADNGDLVLNYYTFNRLLAVLKISAGISDDNGSYKISINGNF